MTAQPRKSVTALIAIHNRVEKTLAALRALHAAELPDGLHLKVIVVDAGSSDGSAEAVGAEFPQVLLLRRSPDLYWASSMREAWIEAARSPGNFLLWLNDDIELDECALTQLFETSEQSGQNAIVGATLVDRRTRNVTYGGYKLGPWWHRLELQILPTSAAAQEADALNGNLVLVPTAVDSALGGFPEHYSHGLADFAYTLNARRRGVRVVVAPGVLGTCSRNSDAGTWTDRSLPRLRRLRLIVSPKGLPPAQWLRYCLSFGGISGFLTFMSPYFKALR